MYYIAGGILLVCAIAACVLLILAKRNKSDWEKTVDDREQSRWATKFAEQENKNNNDTD